MSLNLKFTGSHKRVYINYALKVLRKSKNSPADMGSAARPLILPPENLKSVLVCNTLLLFYSKMLSFAFTFYKKSRGLGNCSTKLQLDLYLG